MVVQVRLNMKSNTLRTRSPIRRQKARNYLLITLVSFALSVSLTRLFLTLTGFPQLGGRELHIAHVLWGGLILFIAALLPLLFTNQWIYTTSAVLSGVGVGLFMDEVGKFITQTNDYFYPPAAPIIYAFFLLVVLIYVDISRRKASDARTEMYYILQDFEEVLDHDLSEEEREDILTHLEHVLQDTTHPDLANLAQSLKNFIQNKDLELVPDTPSFWKRWRLRMEKFEASWLTHNRFRAALVGALLGWSLYTLYYPLFILTQSRDPAELNTILTGLVSQRLVRSHGGMTWFEVHLGLLTAVGLVLFTAAGLLALNKQRRAINLAYVGMLTSLTMVNLLVFYYDQFSAIISAALQLVVLLGILRYRSRFLKSRPDDFIPGPLHKIE
jgi:hypothetical protein